MEARELEAYGLCALTPETFGSLSVPEFYSLLEAAYWREARQTRLLANMVAQLLSPHLKEGANPRDIADRFLGGDPVERIEYARAQRLARKRTPNANDGR